METPWYHDHTPATPDCIATTPSLWNKPWGFPLWARFTGFLAPGTTMRTNWVVVPSFHYATTSVLTATTSTIHPLSAPPPITYAMTAYVASSRHTIKTLVWVAQWMLDATSSTLYSMITTPDSWRMLTLTLEVTPERLDAWKHQSRGGVMS